MVEFPMLGSEQRISMLRIKMRLIIETRKGDFIVIFHFFSGQVIPISGETLVPLCHPESKAKTLIENLLCGGRVLEAQ